LQPPDVETRLAILRKKAKGMGVQLPDEILGFIAQRIRTNIRRLEGAGMDVGEPEAIEFGADQRLQ
jgi:chromosomal replication initiator protein